MKKLFLVALTSTGALMLPVTAQQAAAGGIGDFSIERVLTLASVTSPLTPNVPAVLLGALQSGGLEMRQVLSYNSANRTLEQTNYVVLGKSPLPFPDLTKAAVVDHYLVQVDSVALSQAHGSHAALIGHVISNDIPTPFGDITGSEVTLTFGYQGGGAATTFGPIMESVTPLYNLYAATGVGSLSPTVATSRCSVASLNGVYTYNLRGYFQSSPNTFLPYVENGRFTADGNGNVAVDGVGNIGGSNETNHLAITYTVNDDCTGTFTWKGGSQKIVLANNGQRLSIVFTAPAAAVAMGDAQLQ